MKKTVLRQQLVLVLAALVVWGVSTPTVAQPATFTVYPGGPTVVSGDYCKAAPSGFTCGEEICLTACMTPAEWDACDKRWYASSHDQKFTAPAGATKNNHVRFYSRCGTHCVKAGSPEALRLAFWYAPRTMRDGSNHPGRWVPFEFLPPRGVPPPQR